MYGEFKSVQPEEFFLLVSLIPDTSADPLNQEALCNAKRWPQEETHSQTLEETKLATATEEEENLKQRRRGTSNLIDCLFDNPLATSTCKEEETADDINQKLERYSSANSRFKRLAQLARKYFCCPPSHVSSERVLCTAGNAYDDKTKVFKRENVEKLCFLHYNLLHLDCTYQPMSRIEHYLI